MNIKKIVIVAFCICISVLKTSNTIRVDCFFTKVPWESLNETFYWCEVENKMDFGGIAQPAVVKSVIGNGNLSYDRIEGIQFKSTAQLIRIPSDIAKFLPRLKLLAVVECAGLRRIVRQDFESHTRLTYLKLFANAIEYVDDATFAGNSLLEVIELQNNRIRFIEPLAFSHLAGLRFLDLSANDCQIAYSSANERKSVEKIVADIESQQCIPHFYLLLTHKLDASRKRQQMNRTLAIVSIALQVGVISLFCGAFFVVRLYVIKRQSHQQE